MKQNLFVEDRTVKQRLAAIPKANPSMKTDQLRQICIAFFKLQLSFPWIPSQPYAYRIKSKKIDRKLPEDAVLGGLPYVSVGSGSLYRALEYYDEKTGVLDLSELGKDPVLFGNACSGSACMAWSRVVSSAKMSYTSIMTKKNGYLPIGPYRYEDDLELFIKNAPNEEENRNPKQICKENGEQVMFESYAALLPADGLVNPTHVRMNVFRPRVVRREDGSIDGEKSWTSYMDQHIPFSPKTQWDGSPIKVQGGVDVKITFQKLFEEGYLPFTFAEFLGTEKVKEPTATIDVSTQKVNVKNLLGATLSANYNISDLYADLQNQSGQTKRITVRSQSFIHRKIALSVLNENDLNEMLSCGECAVTLSCRLFSGDTITVYTGTLVP